MHEDRLHPIPGTLNFRDLGGYAGHGGRRVPYRRVFRSDAFVETGAEGWHQVASLGVRVVVDLRMPVEQERTPNRIPADLGIATRHIPIGGEATGVATILELLSTRPASDFGLDAVTDMNRELLRDSAPAFGAALAEIASASGAVVFHCTAGKDRTGMVAALLLSVLGVGRADVVADYELTTSFRSLRRREALRPELEAIGVDIDAVFPYLSAPGPCLQIVLDELDERHGSIEGYLTHAAGLGEELITALQQRLLE